MNGQLAARSSCVSFQEKIFSFLSLFLCFSYSYSNIVVKRERRDVGREKERIEIY